MFAGFITSGNAGAEVYGVTYNTLKVHQAIFISRDPDIYEMNRLPLPQGLHHSKRGQLLQETSACIYSIENQGIPWMKHCPILGRIHIT